MSTTLRYVGIVVLLIVSIFVKVALDLVPITGGAGLLWRSLTYAIVLTALIFACMKVWEKTKPPENKD